MQGAAAAQEPPQGPLLGPPKMQRLFSEEDDDWQVVHGTLADLLDSLEDSVDLGDGPATAAAAGRGASPFGDGSEHTQAEVDSAQVAKQAKPRHNASRRLSRPAKKVPIDGEMAPLGHGAQQYDGGYLPFDGRAISTSQIGNYDPNAWTRNGRYRSATEVAGSPANPEYDIYIVERGDTLPGVALRHNMSVAQLKKINRLFDSRIFQGQQLNVLASHDHESSSPPIYPQLPARAAVELQNLGKESEAEERDTDSMDYHRQHGQLLSEPIDIPRFLSDVTLLRSNGPLQARSYEDTTDHEPGIEPKSPRSWKAAFPFLQRNRSLSFAGVGSPVDSAVAQHPQAAQGGFWWRNRPGPSDDNEGVRPGLFFRRKAAQPQAPTYSRPTSTTTVQADLAYIQAEALANLRNKKRFDEIQYASDARSNILSEDMMQKLHDVTAEDLHANLWKLIYSTERDGTSLQRFLQLASGAAPTVIIIETMEQEVFGGVAFTEWSPNLHYFGTGDAMLFKANFDEEDIIPYHWTRQNTLLQYCTNTLIGMGGGNGYFGFLLDDSFHRGTSHSCATFDNDPLASSEDFLVNKLEVWTLLSPLDQVPEKYWRHGRLQST